MAWGRPDGEGNPLAMLLYGWTARSLLGPTGEPSLAASWTMSGDRARLTLAEDATWSDGRPLRAAEVVTLLQRAAAQGDLAGLRRATALDERTITLSLADPLCPALTAAASWPLRPDEGWPPARTSRLAVQPLGDDQWQLGPAIHYRRYPDERALRRAWERGEINAVVGARRLTEGPLAGPQRATGPAGPLLATLLFRMGDPLTGEAALREALTLATDRAALYAAAYGEAPTALLRALLPPGHWAEAAEPLPEADPQAAAQQLERLGWRDRDGDGVREGSDGTPLRLVLSIPLSADLHWEALGHALKAQWGAVGVEVQLLYLEPFALQERLHSERWQVALLPYSVAADPDQSAMWRAPDDLMAADLNVTGYANGAVAELMQQGARVEGCRPADRAPFYQRAWAILLTERPIWPLFPLPLDLTLRPEAVEP